MNFICHECGKTYRPEQLAYECSCGGYLKTPDRPIRKAEILTGDQSMWRYRRALPVGPDDPVISLGEGMTPLVRTTLEGLLFKADSMMPTGSFKDRGAALVMSSLKRLGVRKVINDSSGNAAAAYAAYATAAGMECHIFAPASTSAGKLVQIAMYGARVTKVAGTRADVTAAAKAEAAAQCGKAVYAGHNQHPLFPEGCKTMAYEIWEQLGFEAPDNVVVPYGGGSTMLGLFKGFRELLSVGEVAEMPRFFVIQAENCNPLYTHFFGREEETRFEPGIAEGIAIAQPIKKVESVALIRQSGGRVETVTEGEILDGLTAAARAGFYVEPTTAATVAGAMRLRREGTIGADERTIVILTGHGLKATDKIGAAMGLL